MRQYTYDMVLSLLFKKWNFLKTVFSSENVAEKM